MLKKILSSLATLTLIAGSVTTTTAWTEHKNQNKGDAQKQNPQSSQNYSLGVKTFKKDTSLPGSDYNSTLYFYNNIFYYIYNNAVYESTDNGKTFTKNKQISSDDGVTYVYSYNNVVYCSGNGAIYESRDNVKTFNKIPSFSIKNDFYEIYGYNNIVYITIPNGSGLYESKDNGKTFTKNMSSSISNLRINNIYVYNKVIYVSIYDSVTLYESFDNGKTFTKNNSLPGSSGNHADISDIYGYNGVVYLGTEFAGGDGTNTGLYESVDNGKTFRINQALSGSASLGYEINEIYSYNNIIYVDWYNEGSHHDYGLYESTDNGKTFTKGVIPQSIGYICGYGNSLYGASASAGLYESFDNGKTWTINKSIPASIDIGDIYNYNGVVYVDDDGIYEGKSLSTVNQPDKNQNITNLGQTYNYLMYSNPINFTFDWTVLSKVTIVNNSTATPTTKTLTSGSYQIKDDGNYTVTFSFKDGTTADYSQRFLLQNDYDFSQGINAATWDPTTRMLDIYFNQAITSYIINSWADPHGPGATANLLDWMNQYLTPTGDVWNNLISSKKENLQDSINNFIPKTSRTPKQKDPKTTFDLLDQTVTCPTIGHTESNYRFGLVNRLTSLSPTKGMYFQLKIDQYRNITQANNPSLGEIPLSPITSGSAQSFQTNYWDQILFNQN